MATFVGEINKDRKRADGTWNVKIRITHNRKLARVSTPIYVTKDDLTRAFKIKSQDILDKIENIVRCYRKACNDLCLEYNNMSIDDLVKYLKEVGKADKNEIDFIAFGREWVELKKKSGKAGTVKNYSTAINAFVKFARRDCVYISEITSNTLLKFSEYLIAEKEKKDNDCLLKNKRVTSNRMISQYMGCLRHLHNEAKEKFNDEENGIIRIPFSPFAKYRVPKQEPSRKRALSSVQMRAIFDLPYKVRQNARKVVDQNCRYNLAKDVFILSFGLMGMNSVDLYNCTNVKDNKIIYNRTKTKDRRDDNAEIEVVIHPFLFEIIEKYRDHTGKNVFRFYQMYSDASNFNQALNKGLKEIAKELKELDKGSEIKLFEIEDLEFYAARHSWATIALNDVKIDKYTVHSALNHVDASMRVTDIYIKKDFTAINEANKKVLQFVFEY